MIVSARNIERASLMLTSGNLIHAWGAKMERDEESSDDQEGDAGKGDDEWVGPPREERVAEGTEPFDGRSLRLRSGRRSVHHERVGGIRRKDQLGGISK